MDSLDDGLRHVKSRLHRHGRQPMIPLDVFIAAAVVNRWLAVPLFGLVAANYHLDGVTVNSWAFAGYAAVFGAGGCVARRAVEAEIREYLAERRVARRPDDDHPAT